LDCLFCQNWHFRAVDPLSERSGSVVRISARELAQCANERTYCACFFGGDPASQMPHALATGRYLAEKGITVCWESAGTMHARLLRRAITISLSSGGCFKFDLTAYDANLHRALTGASNARTLANFALAVSLSRDRSDPPPVIASTLLVPGYVDSEEVGRIASFIAELDPYIPYVLLAFHPHFRMTDLPRTSREHAQRALEAAQSAGLRRIRIGNLHLLGDAY
jgi:pyruvate formate lyase activating enzyme